MPPRRAGRSSSGTHQSVLSFKTPSKIVKNTSLRSEPKKDLKKLVVATPSSSPSVADEVATGFSSGSDIVVSKEALAEYYKTHILGTRCTQPLHQEEVSLQDKVLRHWDMSTQYGPCIGFSRLERWWRAERLGLGPPELVRVVCEGLEDGGRAWMDEALSLRGLCRM